MPRASELESSKRLKPWRSGAASSCAVGSAGSFYTLPELAHDAVAGYLAWTDLLMLMSTSKWSRELYRHQVKCLKLKARRMEKTEDGRVRWWSQGAALHRLFSRLPSFTELHVPNMAGVGLLVEALKGGHVRLVEDLHVNDAPQRGEKGVWRVELIELSVAMKAGALHALRSLSLGHVSKSGVISLLTPLRTPGVCPNFESLELRRGVDMMDIMAITEAFAGRPLQSLRLFGMVRVPLLSLMLNRVLHDHGAQSSLHELVLDGIITQANIDDLSEAIVTTRAVALRKLTLRGIPWTVVLDLAPLTAALRRGARHLRSLLIDCVKCSNPGAACHALATAVRGVALAELEELHLWGTAVGANGWSAVCQAIAQTHKCENLRTLLMVDRKAIGGIYGGVCLALSQGAMGGLRHLDLWCTVVSEDIRALANAVEKFRLTHLEKLCLGRIRDVDRAEFVTLTTALTAAGACPHLRLLSLSFGSLGCDGMMVLAHALKDGALPQLTELDLSHADLSGPCLSAVAEALLAGACPRLQILRLRIKAPARDCRQGIHALADVLAGKAGCSRSLVNVHIMGANLGPLSLQVLSEALRAPISVRLSSLCIKSFRIDHECMHHLVETLEGAAGSLLTKLEVTVSCELDDRDIQLWADAFYAGSLPQLTSFTLDSDVPSCGRPDAFDAANEALRRRRLWNDGEVGDAGGIEKWLQQKRRLQGSVIMRA